MDDSGGNCYKLPHLNKARRRNQREFVSDIVCGTPIYNLVRKLAKEDEQDI